MEKTSQLCWSVQLFQLSEFPDCHDQHACSPLCCFKCCFICSVIFQWHFPSFQHLSTSFISICFSSLIPPGWPPRPSSAAPCTSCHNVWNWTMRRNALEQREDFVEHFSIIQRVSQFSKHFSSFNTKTSKAQRVETVTKPLSANRTLHQSSISSTPGFGHHLSALPTAWPIVPTGAVLPVAKLEAFFGKQLTLCVATFCDRHQRAVYHGLSWLIMACCPM